VSAAGGTFTLKKLECSKQAVRLNNGWQHLCVASLVFTAFSVFKVVYHEHPFAFSPAFSVMP